MLKKLIVITISAGLLYSLYTGDVTWNPCDLSAGFLACWRLNPTVLPALIVITALALIVLIQERR